MPKEIRRFIVIAQVTLIFVYLVIIAGAVVRATGSGMGCPDWPKCFGKWIPPTDVSQLPENYIELYAGEHHAVAPFNVLNTWTEYLNRLAGALLGLLIFVQFFLSLPLRKVDVKLFRYSLLELILIGFQGWLGAKVVSSNLAPVKITIHMVVALVILSIALLIIFQAKELVREESVSAGMDSSIKRISMFAFIATIIQILLGTQVREEVDMLLRNIDNIYRYAIISNLNIFFKIHRSFSIVILILNFWLFLKIRKNLKTREDIITNSQWLGVVLVIAFITGVTLSFFGLPAPIQPLHLLLACIIYGIQWVLILKLWKKPA